MALSHEDMQALQAYSTGRIGWREACKRLALMDHGELHDLLDAQGLPLPPEADNPLDPAMAERFGAILRGA